MDYRKIIVIVLSIILLNACKPRPNLDIIVNASFKVTPNTKSIRLGDTLRLNLNANANFPTIDGGTYLFNDGTFFVPFFIAETERNDTKISYDESFKIYSKKGTIERNTGDKMFAKAMSNCVNDQYNIDFYIIPQKKDTFFIQFSRGNLFNNRTSVGASIRFDTNDNNLHILPNGTIGSSQINESYAFIVE